MNPYSSVWVDKSFSPRPYDMLIINSSFLVYISLISSLCCIQMDLVICTPNVEKNREMVKFDVTMPFSHSKVLGSHYNDLLSSKRLVSNLKR